MDDLIMRLFEDFAARRARGERPDPLEYVARAGDDAEELRGLLDRLLTGPPPSEPSPETVAVVAALAEGEPPLLGLRRHRRLRVDAVVDALVAHLGLDPSTRPKVRRNYQRLEGGLLDPRRIDARLREALAGALGIAPRDLAIGPGAPPASPPAPAFARGHDVPAAAAAGPPPQPEEEPDEVDRLFGIG